MTAVKVTANKLRFCEFTYHRNERPKNKFFYVVSKAKQSKECEGEREKKG